MSGPDGVEASRREFLAGKGHADESALRAESGGGTEIPQAGDTRRIQTRAMNCQFAVCNINDNLNVWKVINIFLAF